MAKREKDPGLKLNVPWEEAAEKLLRTPPGTVPPRKTATRKKSAKKKPSK